MRSPCRPITLVLIALACGAVLVTMLHRRATTEAPPKGPVGDQVVAVRATEPVTNDQSAGSPRERAATATRPIAAAAGGRDQESAPPTRIARSSASRESRDASGAGPFVDAIIDGMSRDEVIAWLGQLTDYGVDEFDSVEDVHEFARRYARLTLTVDPVPTVPDTEASPIGLVSFSNFIRLDDNDTTMSVESFVPGTKKIYAVFDAADVDGDKVVARWVREGGDRPISVERLDIDPHTPSGFVSYLQPEGWTPGDYFVELFDEESLEIVARGTFWIDVETSLEHPDA